MRVLRLLPHILALSALGALLKFESGISIYLSAEDSPVEMQDLFAAVFDWSSIQTGFLFAVYGYVASKSDGFIGAIRKTTAMTRFRQLLAFTIFAGFALTLVSMCFLIYPLTPIPGWEYTILSFWFAGFCWSFLLFCAVAYRFGVIVRVPDPA